MTSTRNFTAKFWSFFFYLLFFAAAVAVVNYYALFFKDQGLPGSQIGILIGMASLVRFFAGPLLSGLADSSHHHRLVLSVAIVGNAAAVFLIPFFQTFAGFLALMITQAFFLGPILPMMDSNTIAMLGDEKEMYGRIRLGGSIGWGVAAILIGLIVERFGLRWNFVYYGVVLLIVLMITQRLQFRSVPAITSIFSSVKDLLGNRRWIIFLSIMLIAGSGNAVITNYLLVYLQKIGTSPAWMGLALTLSTLAEAPALFFADRMLRRFGPRGLLTLGLAGLALRCGLYGLIDVPWAALIVQLMQFVSFPILLVAGVSYADQHAPTGMAATAQSLFNSAFLGFGSAAGAFLGGVLIQYVGVQQMFLTFAGTILIVALIFALAGQAQKSRQPA